MPDHANNAARKALQAQYEMEPLLGAEEIERALRNHVAVLVSNNKTWKSGSHITDTHTLGIRLRYRTLTLGQLWNWKLE